MPSTLTVSWSGVGEPNQAAFGTSQATADDPIRPAEHRREGPDHPRMDTFRLWEPEDGQTVLLENTLRVVHQL